jgi:hypothetical protein
MRPAETLPHSAVRRAAALARGPHACPSCEAPTFAEPPVPWTDLRDYVVRCDSCDRPVSVRVDRDLVLDPHSAPRDLRDAPGMYEPVEELLERRSLRAFRLRVAAALALPSLVGLVTLLSGGGVQLALLLYTAAVLPGAWFGPALFMSAFVELTELRACATGLLPGNRVHHLDRPVEVEAGRWDQWMREERRRERERAEQPEAVLRELERVLDERELRRVRAMAVHGVVPPEHLDDLLRFKRSWTSVA